MRYLRVGTRIWNQWLRSVPVLSSVMRRVFDAPRYYINNNTRGRPGPLIFGPQLDMRRWQTNVLVVKLRITDESRK